nr:hypothetical protein [Clostridia bacterium]
MKKNKLCIITMLLLVFSLIVTVMMSIFTVLAGIVNKAIPPVIALLLNTVFFVWIDIIYLNCYKCLKTTGKTKTIHKLKVNNLILSVIMLSLSVSMWSILFYTIIFRLFFEALIYFFVVAIIATAYAINGILINKAFAKNV